MRNCEARIQDMNCRRQQKLAPHFHIRVVQHNRDERSPARVCKGDEGETIKGGCLLERKRMSALSPTRFFAFSRDAAAAEAMHALAAETLLPSSPFSALGINAHPHMGSGDNEADNSGQNVGSSARKAEKKKEGLYCM